MLYSKLVSISVLIILGAAIGIAADRYWLMPGEPDTISTEGESALEHARKHLAPDYVCPMHSDVVSKEPASCPICGMDLVEREPEVQTMSQDSGLHSGLPEVVVTPEFIHNFGVRTAKVSRGPVSRHILALGRVSRMPQPRVTDVAPGMKGNLIWVSDKQIGDEVDKGELLYTVDVPEWRSLQQLYLDAIEEENLERSKQLKQRLQALGMDNLAVKQLEESGQVQQMLDVKAPVKGVIVDWRAVKGDVVIATSKVTTLGGINRVPVVVSLFEGQSAWVNNGQRAVFRVPTLPGIEFVGKVDRPDREINFSTRTLTIYTGFNTADPRVRYGMLVEVEIHASAREDVLRIPREALIRTGQGDRVIVALGDGRFKPVSVVPGIESGDVIEVLSGLDEGQEVIVSGQFLIDSESNLKSNFQRMEMGENGQ